MKLFGKKRRHGRRAAGSAPVRRVAPQRPSRQLSRQWRRRFRKLLRMQAGNRRVAQSNDGRRVTAGKELLENFSLMMGHGLAYLGVIVAVGLLPVGLWAGYHELLRAPHFLLREIEISGNGTVAADAIVAAAGLDRPVNTLTIDEDEVARAIRNLPWIRTADVKVVLPREVRLTVSERRPTAVVAMGAQYLVDERGALFTAAHPEDVLGLPLITGFQREDFTDPSLQPEARRRVRSALAVLRAWKAAGLEATTPLSELESHRVYGHILRLRDGGAEIWLGTKDYEEKLARAADVIADLHQRGRRAKHIYLDTEDALNRVVVETQSAGSAGLMTLKQSDAVGVGRY